MPGFWRNNRWWREGQQKWQHGGQQQAVGYGRLQDGGEQQWQDGEEQQWQDEQGRSRSPHRHRRRVCSPGRPPVDERLLALFGDMHVGSSGFPTGGEEMSEPRWPGGRPVLMRWFRPEGSVPHLFTGATVDEWHSLSRVVAKLSGFAVLPDYAVISISGKALETEPTERYSDPKLRVDHKEVAENIVTGLGLFMDIARMMVPSMCPIILSVCCEPNSTLAKGCRQLSAALWQLARQRDAMYIDVERSVRRFSAASLTGKTEPGGDWTANTSREKLREELRKEMREELRKEMREELMEELREELRSKDEPQAKAVEPHASAEKPQRSAGDPQASADAPTKDSTADLAAVGPSAPFVQASPSAAFVQASPSAALVQAGPSAALPVVTAAPVSSTASAVTTSASSLLHVPWQSGWVPGQPPPPLSDSEPGMPGNMWQYGDDGWGEPRRTDVSYQAVRLEILRIAAR